jgi:hypothetical protein
MAFVPLAQPLQGNGSHATSRLKLKGDVIVEKERKKSHVAYDDFHAIAYVSGRAALEAYYGYEV